MILLYLAKVQVIHLKGSWFNGPNRFVLAKADWSGAFMQPSQLETQNLPDSAWFLPFEKWVKSGCCRVMFVFNHIIINIYNYLYIFICGCCGNCCLNLKWPGAWALRADIWKVEAKWILDHSAVSSVLLRVLCDLCGFKWIKKQCSGRCHKKYSSCFHEKNVFTQEVQRPNFAHW